MTITIKHAERGTYQAALDAAVPEQWTGCLTAETFKKKGEGLYFVRYRSWAEFTVQSEEALTHDQLIRKCSWHWCFA